eukprot:UN01215
MTAPEPAATTANKKDSKKDSKKMAKRSKNLHLLIQNNNKMMLILNKDNKPEQQQQNDNNTTLNEYDINSPQQNNPQHPSPRFWRKVDAFLLRYPSIMKLIKCTCTR